MKPSQIRNDIAKKTKKAVKIAQPQFYALMQSVVHNYYSEFVPKRYFRTYQLYNSLDLSGVRAAGLGAVGDIYFDVSKMSYEQGAMLLKSQPEDYGLVYGWATWDAPTVLTMAMSGSHGGYKSGTPIWTSSLSLLNATADSILTGSCRAAGL